jgi:Anti-sigma-K factor rskA/Putative zinc-finger
MPDNAAPHVEVAGYALGKLDHDETVAFEAHLAECAACRRELEELRGLPEMLARAAPPVRLPGTLRARTLAAVRQAAQEAADAGEAAGELRSAGLRHAPELVRRPAEPARAEPRRRRAPSRLAAVGRRPWLAAAVAAALVVLLSIPVSLLLNRPATSELALVAPDGGAGKGRALVTRSDGMRTFDVRIEGLRPPKAGTLYELWAVGDADTPHKPQRVSLGTFTVPVSGNVRLRAFTAAPESVYRKVGVTEEPDDGNPARQGPVVLRPGG